MKQLIFILFLFSPMAMGAVGAPEQQLDVSVVLEIMKDRDPDRLESMRALEKGNPSEFHKKVEEFAAQNAKWIRMRKVMPQNYELQLKMWDNREKLAKLRADYIAAESDATKIILKNLVKDILNQQFEYRWQQKQNRISFMQSKLNRMKLRQEQESKKQQAFVNQWSEKLLR